MYYKLLMMVLLQSPKVRGGGMIVHLESCDGSQIPVELPPGSTVTVADLYKAARAAGVHKPLTIGGNPLRDHSTIFINRPRQLRDHSHRTSKITHDTGISLLYIQTIAVSLFPDIFFVQHSGDIDMTRHDSTQLRAMAILLSHRFKAHM